MFVKLVRSFILLLVFTFAGLAVFCISVIPFSDIEKIKNGYTYSIATNSASVEYKLTSKSNEQWIPFSDIDNKAVHAIVVSEDWSFYEHNGVDFTQLKSAAIDLALGKRFRGASTISQQVAKNLFLSDKKSFYRKFKEMLIATFMEIKLSKRDILELYLNVIEYGEDLYGIANASKYYFDKHPKNLSPREGAFLAMLLPNPRRYSVSFDNRELTPFAKTIISDILHKMSVAKYITMEEEQIELISKFDWEFRFLF
jgi:monofunctional glycosyltransferase